MTADVNRQLLFGLIALQVGLIDQAQLGAAVQAWTRDKSRPLADHLAGQGGLDADGRAAVEALVALYIQKHGGDTERSLASIPAGRATREQLATLSDSELTSTIAQLDSGLTVADTDRSRVEGAATLADSELTRTIAHLGPGSTGPVVADRSANHADGQRFRILRPHAQGGLGAVFVALDGELHREVALKQILDSHADNPISRQRFLLEAEITGGLEHPGIVPVYGLGAYGDGRPYYAMRFISGDSLKEVIDGFHSDQALKTDPGRRSLELRKLLRRFTDVCNAIDFAHSRGVLHRDIKPSNVIVGKHGETLVVDWGVAKPLGRVEPGMQAGERPLVPSPVSGSTETLPGSALGTPAYMSPEQAEGDLERLGPASDVYSLGATLYTLLTGRPPFAGKDVAAVLAAVKKSEFARPRRFAPSIDKALEAICVKAMATKPEDRYGTPRALADDIEHWLADEPAKAYPEQPLERLGRWLRQHRTWTYAAVAGLIGISLAATIGVVVVDGARRREAVVRKEAETNFNMALKAVEDYLTSVSENTLLKQQDSVDMRSLRQELLNTALKYYKDFVNQRSKDPNLRRQLANAYFRVGEITQEIDSRVEAIEAFHSAQIIWEELAAANSTIHEFRGNLADCHLAIGRQKSAVGDLQGALTSLNQARDILEPLAARHVDQARYQARLAECYSEIGSVQGTLHSGDQGLESLQKARAIQNGLIAQYPEEMRYRQRLAVIINVLGYVYNKRLENAEAIRCFEEVQEICQSLLEQVTAGPKPVQLLNLIASSHYNIATIHIANLQYDKALESLEKSLKSREELVAAHPSVTSFRESLGESYGVFADIQHRAHHDDEAFSSLQKSIDILEKLVEADPDSAIQHGWLGRSLNALGFFHDELRHNLQAIPAFERAVKEQERAIAQSPDDDEFKILLIIHLSNLGEQYVDLGQVERGLPYYRRGIEIRRQLLTAHPEKRAYLLDLADDLSTLGNVQRHAGDSTSARDTFADARSLLERGIAAMPGDGSIQVRLGVALVREASALADLGEPAKARPLLERAVKTLSGGVVSSTEEAQRREWRSEALWEFARILRSLNRPSEAYAVDAQRVALWQDRPSGELVSLALKETSLAALIGYGKTPVPPAALAVRELDLDQAAANLNLAVARGYRNIRRLQSHPDTQVLLSRDDIKLFIMDMAFPDRPFAVK